MIYKKTSIISINNKQLTDISYKLESEIQDTKIMMALQEQDITELKVPKNETYWNLKRATGWP